MRASGITVLLLLALLPLVHVHPHRTHGLLGLVQARLDRLEAQRRARMTVPDEAHIFPSWYPRIEHDRLDAIMGTIRVERLNGVVSVAEDRPAGSFFAATELFDGWLFASNDGVLYRTITFTGPLETFDRVPRELHFHPECYGRMVLGDSHGRWWTTDGRSRLAALPMREHALVMAFASSLRGAAVAQGGRLIATDDGGHTWRPVHTDLIAYNVSGSPDGLMVETLDGLRTLLPDLTLTPNVAMPWPQPRDVAFLRAVQHVPSLELPSGGVERLQEFALGEQSFHVGVFQCHESPGVPRPMPDVHGEFLAQNDREGLGPAAARIVALAGREKVSITWRGIDARGDYAHVLRRVELPSHGDKLLLLLDDMRLRVSTRTGAVIDVRDRPENLVWITINGTATALPPLGTAPGMAHNPSFQPLPDGGVVMYDRVTVAADLAHSPFPHGGAIPVTMLIAREIHTDGTLGDRMGVLLSRDEGAVVAVQHDDWGIAVLPPHASDDILFYPSDHSPPRPLGLLPTDAMPACGYVQPPDATVLWDYGGDSLHSDQEYAEVDGDPPPYVLQGAREGIEISPRGACLRRIEGPRNFEAQPEWRLGALRLDAQPGNFLTGTVDDGTRVRNVRCSGVGDILPSASVRQQ